MNDIHPGLKAIYKTIRGRKLILGILGILVFFVGVVLVAVLINNNYRQDDIDIPNLIAYIIFSLLFLVPGFFMIRSWIRGPKGTNFVKLLTSNSDNLVGYDIKYVVLQTRYATRERAPEPHFVLFSKDNKKYEERLNTSEEKDVKDFISGITQRIDKNTI